MAEPTPARVSLDDIRAKVGEIEQNVTGFGERAGDISRPALILLAAVGVILVYMLGKRRGQKRSAVIEVTRL